jgi:hypothetical protein
VGSRRVPGWRRAARCSQRLIANQRFLATLTADSFRRILSHSETPNAPVSSVDIAVVVVKPSAP